MALLSKAVMETAAVISANLGWKADPHSPLEILSG
jgi:hypothetical protein